jgi:hypothetical protein
MDLQTAIEILEYHQQWRLGKREDMIHEPKKLTEALDIVISEVKKFRLGAVVGRSEQLLAFKKWEAEKCKLPWDASPEQIIEQYLSQ